MAASNNSGYAWAITSILSRNLHLPIEIALHIVDFLCNASPWQGHESCTTAMPSSCANPKDPSIPPANGSSPFMILPTELRRAIFCSSLLAREIPLLPLCQEHFNASKDGETPAKHNRTSDLMVINKEIKDEITGMIYEERTFVIHVHEGIRKAGIEFLDTGRQPLQYQDELTDSRFRRFQHGDEFGFHRIKKVQIIIFPSDIEDSISNHVPINTFFICSALARLLDRGDGEGSKNKINRLSIEFAERMSDSTPVSGRRAIIKAQNYWWDPDAQSPRGSSWHNISNVEIALRGFSGLRSHNVDIVLPKKFENHQQTLAFAANLKGIIQSSASSSELDEDFWNYQINAARKAMEEHVLTILYNGSGSRHHVADLTADDFQEDLDDGDVKHDLSPTSKHQSGSDKRRKALAVRDDDESSVQLIKEILGKERDKTGNKQRAAMAAFKSSNPAQVYRVRWNVPNAATRKYQPEQETSSSPTRSSSIFMKTDPDDNDDKTWRYSDLASIEAHEDQQPGNFVFPASSGRVLGVARHDSCMGDASTDSGHTDTFENPGLNCVDLVRPRLGLTTSFALSTTQGVGKFGFGRTIASAASIASPLRALHSELAALGREREKRMREREMHPCSETVDVEEYNAASAFAKLRSESGVTSVDATLADSVASSQSAVARSGGAGDMSDLVDKWVLRKKGWRG